MAQSVKESRSSVEEEPERKRLVEKTARGLTLLQVTTEIQILYQIQQQGNTTNVSALSFVEGLTSNLASLRYGQLRKDPAILQGTYENIALYLMFCVIYLFYSNEKWNEIGKLLLENMLMVLAVWGYSVWEDPDFVEWRYGVLSSALKLLHLGTPLMGMTEMVASGDASRISAMWAGLGMGAKGAWSVYGLLKKDKITMVESILGFFICGLQVTLCLLYPGDLQTKTSKAT